LRASHGLHEGEAWRLDVVYRDASDNTQHAEISNGTTINGDVREKFDVDVTIQQADGTKEQNAHTWVGETAPSVTLPTDNRQETDANGFATSEYLRRLFEPSAIDSLTTTAHTDSFFKAYKYTFSPFVSSLGNINAKQIFTGIVITDPNINQTTQATAESDGAGITVTRDSATPFAIVAYDAGSGTMTDGDTLTGLSSGVTATFRELFSGVLAGTGRIVVENTSGAFTDGETIDADGGPTWAATSDATGTPQEDFTWGINGNALSLQTIYDFLSAKIANTDAAIDAIFRTAIEWGEDENVLLLQATGSDSYQTARTVRITEGVILYNYGAGTVNFFTGDDGTTVTPPATVTLSVTVKSASTGGTIEGVTVFIDEDPVSVPPTIASGSTNSSGVFSTSFTYTGDVNVTVRARLRGLVPVTVLSTIVSTGLSVPITMTEDAGADRRE